MAKGFGKIKRVFGKKDKGNKDVDKNDAPTPSSTPTRNADVLQPHVVHVNNYPANYNNGQFAAGAVASDTEPLLGGSHTGADDVLDGILQDLNIKVGQLAVDAERTDTVSEYSGGSAKSVESSDSESGSDDDDEETDGDDEETDEETDEDEDAEVKATGNIKHSVGDRVAAVVAAAEEIRKKKGASPSRPSSPAAPSPAVESNGRITPSTEAVRSASPGPVASHASRDQVSKAASSSKGMSKAESRTSKSSKQQLSQSSLRRTPVKNLMKKAKSASRSNTPQFSPEVKSSNNKDKSFDTRDDCDRTKDTQEVSEEEDDERTFESRSENEETLDDGTIDDGTLGTDGESYEEGDTAEKARSMSMSQNGESTFDEEERMQTKKTVMNKDIIIHQPGGPSSLVVRAMYYTPLPASPDDIIIKVEASTVSFRDCLLRRDIGIDKITFPFVPGCEVVGRISNIGKAARQEGYRVGDRVVGITRKGGGNGYYAKFSTKNVAPIISTNIDAADAVCLADVYMTAYQALRVGKKDGTPLTDANVLVTDGFSPVGQAAVQLAKLEGANVYVTTMESRQDDYMKSLGVKCLPLAPSKWLHKLKGKMDIVIDNTCFDSYDSSWKALNSKGVLVCTGMTSIYSFQDFNVGNGGCACEAFGDIRDYQAKWAAVKARYMMSQTKFHDLWESFQKNPKKYQQELKYLCFLVESGTLKPKIAERVSIEEVPDAQRYLETGKANGTIVCLP